MISETFRVLETALVPEEDGTANPECAPDSADAAADEARRESKSLQAYQVGPHISGALVAQVAVFLESFVEDALQICEVYPDSAAQQGSAWCPESI